MLETQSELLRASALHRARKFDEAIGCCEAVLAKEPDNSSAMHLAGLAHLSAGRGGRAVPLFRHCLEIRPDFAEAHANLARALLAQDKAPEALEHCRRACELAPDRAGMHANLGKIFQALGRHDEGAAAFGRALELKPRMPGALNGRGNSLKYLGRLEEAAAAFEAALELAPESAVIWNNLANTCCDLKRFERADSAYARALALRPDSADIRYNRSIGYLLRGDFERGWEDFECRWGRAKGARPRSFSAPRWTGRESLAGRSILLHAEQGLGDTLHFVRYARILARRWGAEVMLQVQPPLRPLFASLPEAKGVFALGRPIPPVDFQCPLMSLPSALGTRIDSIPSSVPYLAAPTDRVKRWQRELQAASRPRVGIAWAGNPRHPNDRLRSIAFARIRQALAGLPGSFFSLQKIVRSDERVPLKSTPEVADLSSHIRDFADTAAIASALDLVIAVDTAVAHLVGALALPGWVLLPYAPDWRWMLDRADSPWYPSLRLFRQPAPGDWSSVFAAMRAQWPRS